MSLTRIDQPIQLVLVNKTNDISFFTVEENIKKKTQKMLCNLRQRSFIDRQSDIQESRPADTGAHDR